MKKLSMYGAILMFIVAIAGSSVCAMQQLQGDEAVAAAITPEGLARIIANVHKTHDDYKSESDKRNFRAKQEKEARDWAALHPGWKAWHFTQQVLLFVWSIPNHAWNNRMTVLKVLVLIGALHHFGLCPGIIDWLMSKVMALAGGTVRHLIGMGTQGVHTLMAHAVMQVCREIPACAVLLAGQAAQVAAAVPVVPLG